MNITMDTESENAVRIRQAYKKIGGNVILKGLDMKIPCGKLYGLLGASGCGKTTLLNCIVGRIGLDSGEIITKAKYKADIGYMPQDLALYSVLSIHETLIYYGRLYGMKREDIDIRTDELVLLMALPPSNTLIEQLSGGQQRRVSLAVALIHDPQLLILDEPTVGLDPLLCQIIWTHFLELVKNGKHSILLTTHYIEDTKQADIVGLMRNGILLSEESPRKLLAHSNCDSLESVILELSFIQQNAIKSCKNVVEPYVLNESKSHLNNGGMFLWSRFIAQFIKNYYFLWRNKPMIFLLLCLPISVCSLFNTCFGHTPSGLKVAWVTDELTDFTNCNMFNLTGCNANVPLSCRLINNLQNKTMELIQYKNLTDAKLAVSTNDAWGLLHFPKNYSTALLSRINLEFTNSDSILEMSQLNVWLDMTNLILGNFIKRDLFVGYSEFLQDMDQSCGWSSQFLSIPVRFEDPIYGHKELRFTDVGSPALMIILMFHLPVVFIIGTIMYEKTTGLLERCLVAGVTWLEIFTALSIFDFLLMCIQGIIGMIITYCIFSSTLEGSLFWSTTLLMLQGTNGIIFGFVIAFISDTNIAANILAAGSFIFLCFVSGLLWPREGMHPILQSMEWFLPTNLPAESLRAITARGWSIDHPIVIKGFTSTIGSIVFFSILINLIFRFRNMR